METQTVATGMWPSRFWGKPKDREAIEQSPTVKVLREKCPDAIVAAGYSLGDLQLTIRPSDIKQVAAALRDHPELQFDQLMDVCGVDRMDLDADGGRFAAVYHFYSTQKQKRLRVVAPLEEVQSGADRKSRASLADTL